MIIFGIEELPRPRGDGFLYYKLDLSGREFLVDYLNLYNISDDELSALLRKAVEMAREHLIDEGRAKEFIKKEYKTENMSDWRRITEKSHQRVLTILTHRNRKTSTS